MKKSLIPFVICVVLLGMNIFTVIYYERRISEMRSKSSFRIFQDFGISLDGKEALVECLHNAMIEYRVDEDIVLVREIDSNSAVANCS